MIQKLQTIAHVIREEKSCCTTEKLERLGVPNGLSRGLIACGATTSCTPQINITKEILLTYTKKLMNNLDILINKPYLTHK
jgi:hypothetical protein